MALRNREKILAGIVALLLAVLAAYYVLPLALRGNATERQQRARLAAEVAKKQTRIDSAQKALAQLSDWERQSLPSDKEVAPSLYQNWLTQLIDRFKFRRSRVEPGEGRAHRGMYTSFPFTVRGHTTLRELVQFLYAFYSAGHLHQVRSLTCKPIEDSKDVDVVLTIEALMLPGADRRDKLSGEPGKRLVNKNAESYEKTILERNPFQPFHPIEKTPVYEPKKPSFDASKYAYLTGITARDGQLEAWFVSRINDRTLRLHEGEVLDIEPFKGKVLRIGAREVELETKEGARVVFPLGRNLQGAGDDARRPDSKEEPRRSGDAAADGPARPEAGPPGGFRGDPRRSYRGGPPGGDGRGEPGRDRPGDEGREKRPR